MFPFDHWVLFEEFYPEPHRDLMLTFRVRVHVIDADRWAANDYEIKATSGRDVFLPLTLGEPAWALCKTAVEGAAGYASIEEAVAVEIAERRQHLIDETAIARAEELRDEALHARSRRAA